MEIYTIGYTQKTAEEFFGLLKEAGIQTVVDVRLNNSSQLAAFTKRSDLPFFLNEICGADYVHELQFAPTREILTTYRKKGWNFDVFSRDILQLLADRKVESTIDRSLFDRPAVLLCSEPEPDTCHRRLVAEYLQEKWENVSIIHL